MTKTILFEIPLNYPSTKLCFSNKTVETTSEKCEIKSSSNIVTTISAQYWCHLKLFHCISKQWTLRDYITLRAKGNECQYWIESGWHAMLWNAIFDLLRPANWPTASHRFWVSSIKVNVSFESQQMRFSQWPFIEISCNSAIKRLIPSQINLNCRSLHAKWNILRFLWFEWWMKYLTSLME